MSAHLVDEREVADVYVELERGALVARRLHVGDGVRLQLLPNVVGDRRRERRHRQVLRTLAWRSWLGARKRTKSSQRISANISGVMSFSFLFQQKKSRNLLPSNSMSRRMGTCEHLP